MGKKAVVAGDSIAVENLAEGTVAETTPGGEEQEENEPVACIHEYTDVEFRKRFSKVFESLMKRAEQGSIRETKLLLEIGKFGDPKMAKRRDSKTLSEMLMDELKRRQDEHEAAVDAAKANDASNEGAKSGGEAE